MTWWFQLQLVMNYELQDHNAEMSHLNKAIYTLQKKELKKGLLQLYWEQKSIIMYKIIIDSNMKNKSKERIKLFHSKLCF